MFTTKIIWLHEITAADCCSIWVHDPAASATGPDPRNDMVEAMKILYQEGKINSGKSFGINLPAFGKDKLLIGIFRVLVVF